MSTLVPEYLTCCVLLMSYLTKLRLGDSCNKLMQKETDDKINFARVGKKLNPLHFYYENSVCVCKCI